MSHMALFTSAPNEGRLDRRLSVAPMMDWTDRHCRYFHRLLAPSSLLFTEMVTAEAILHAGAARFCIHDEAEHPLVLQLGGSEPERLARAVEAVAPFSFDEINLNVGCPSPRVQSGAFGACLMAEPELVASCVKAMQNATDVPVTVKCRIGIDDMDPETGLNEFVGKIADVGVKVIYLHARKAWLNGLSPKENRDIPPLDYQRAERLASTRPDLDIILNGGLNSVSDCKQAASAGRFAGVMVGRAAYKSPLVLNQMAEQFYGDKPACLATIGAEMTSYAEAQMRGGVALHHITRHMLGLFNGMKGARQFRRQLSEEVRGGGCEASIISRVFEDCLALNDQMVA